MPNTPMVHTYQSIRIDALPREKLLECIGYLSG